MIRKTNPIDGNLPKKKIQKKSQIILFSVGLLTVTANLFCFLFSCFLVCCKSDLNKFFKRTKITCENISLVGKFHSCHFKY